MPAHTNPDESGTIGEGKPQADTETSAAANEVDGAYADGPALPRTNKVVLVMDLVESVRLMAQDESGVVARWHGFTKKASKLIPRHRGRIVKSLGDGLLAEFDHSRDAVQVATALHKMIQPANQGRGQDQQLWLRVGINATPVYVDAIDIYGSGVNLAARLAGLAGPGETIASASVRDQLTDGLDADVEDMGECYLKHVEEPVRAYRVGPPGPRPVLMPEKEYNTPLQPTIAVIPFTSRSNAPEHFAIGELIADGVIHQLSVTGTLRVVSQLSTSALRGRNDQLSQAQSHFRASYVLSGSYVCTNKSIVVLPNLTDAVTSQLVWSDRIQVEIADILQAESELARIISVSASLALLSREVEYASQNPLPTLHSYSLMTGAVTLMHRASQSEFRRARTLLDHLINLHGRHAQPFTWLGKWYVIQTAQGWSTDPVRDANEALGFCQRALDFDNHSALALAVTGQVHGYLKKDLSTAESMYRKAIEINPNESLAWLWLGITAAFRGEGEAAISSTEYALSLSPLDPIRYYYLSLAASAAIAGAQYDRAIELGKASLRANRSHSSTYRALAIAQALGGRLPEARTTVKQLLLLEPNFTIRTFLARYPGRDEAKDYTNMLGSALGMAGLPA